MTIAVVAVQGAFIEQEQRLQELGVDCIELRKKEDLEQPYDGIVLPGGESTVQGKLLKELDMFDTIHKQIQEGMPVFATCAGLILLAGELENDTRSYFKTLPVTVRRNAYGRQLGSFHTTEEFEGIGKVPMTFIRAPFVEKAEEEEEESLFITSPIVGTFYSAAAPDVPAFVKVGDQVKAGQTVCILEAMKLMNEIQSDYDCEIEAVLVSNEQKVEYGQPLFRVKRL